MKVALLTAALTCGAKLQAAPLPAESLQYGITATQPGLQPLAFRDSTEANLLRNAYNILATGDHDYKGHRAQAMHSVEAAAKLLGMELRGDGKDKEPQALSDARLREAEGLITQVLGSAEVKDQKKVVKHLNEAVNHIHAALKVR